MYVCLVILSDLITQAQNLLHSLEYSFKGIGRYVNAGKTEYICLNQNGINKTIFGPPPGCVYEITYLGSKITSCERAVNTCISKTWGVVEI